MPTAVTRRMSSPIATGASRSRSVQGISAGSNVAMPMSTEMSASPTSQCTIPESVSIAIEPDRRTVHGQVPGEDPDPVPALLRDRSVRVPDPDGPSAPVARDGLEHAVGADAAMAVAQQAHRSRLEGRPVVEHEVVVPERLTLDEDHPRA